MLPQMLKVESHLTKLRTSLVAIKPLGEAKVSYDLQADIRAVSRDGAKVKIRYDLAIQTFPLVYRAELAGFAHVTVETMAKDESLEDLGESVLSDIALQIYRQAFEPLYLTLSTQGLDAPSPWLFKEVHLAH